MTDPVPTVYAELIDDDRVVVHGFADSFAEASLLLSCHRTRPGQVGRIQFGERTGHLFAGYADSAIILLPHFGEVAPAAA